MGIANTFTFGGVSTSDYGLVVEGSGDYSAPKRAMEAISIPGRNGAFQLDKGYYENITVEYNVVVKGDTHSDFREAISDFRNAIVSQIGYQRLEETYLPGEYRMAKYAGGLDEDPSFHGKGAVFKVKFDCKPQRWLTSGETKHHIGVSGYMMDNPTPFDSSPLLEVEGYGTIEFNGYKIELEDAIMGDVTLLNPQTVFSTQPTFSYSTASLDTGDEINVDGIELYGFPSRSMTNYAATCAVSDSNSNDFTSVATKTGTFWYVTTTLKPLQYEKGTPATYHNVVTISGVDVRSVAYQFTNTIDITLNDSGITVLQVLAIVSGDLLYKQQSVSIGSVTAFSTKSILGHPTYIDCNLGEAYLVSNNEVISLNGHVDLGSKLPVFGQSQSITFDNTITSLDIKPRWWKV